MFSVSSERNVSRKNMKKCENFCIIFPFFREIFELFFREIFAFSISQKCHETD